MPLRAALTGFRLRQTPFAISPNGSSPPHGGDRKLKSFQISQWIRVAVRSCVAGIVVNLLWLCSCATEPSARRSMSADVPVIQAAHCALPPDMPIAPDAGRGGFLMVMVQLENGRELPMILDTGAGSTVLDVSLERKLGKPLGKATMCGCFGLSTNNVYPVPKLYLGGVPLMMTGTEIVTSDVKRLSSLAHHPVMGILGIDVLEHYCIQLDFVAGKMRFLDGQTADKSAWGRSFSIVPVSDSDSRPAVAGNLLGRPGTLSLIDSGWIGDGVLMPQHFQSWTNQVVGSTNGEACAPDGAFGGKQYFFVNLSREDWPSDSIGLNFLARHLVTLDFPNHTLYLRGRSIGPLSKLRTAQLKPIPDPEPEVTAHLRAVMQDWIGGTQQTGDYTASAWKKLMSKRRDIETFTAHVGQIVSLTLVEHYRGIFGVRRSYAYRLECAHATMLMRVVLDGRNKLVSGQSEVVEWKAPPGEI